MSNHLDINQNIVIVGIMGVGKTSVGRRLAKHLAVPFFDSDREVEQSAYSTISDIYELYGEEAFKETEKRVIKRLLENPQPHVLSTGVGSFADDELRQIIKSKAISVWIKGDIDEIVPRVTARRHRPQLENRDTGEVIRGLEAKYLPYYKQADIAIECDLDSSSNTVSRIIVELEKYLSGVSEHN